jgi:hypothetical protein
MSSWCWRTRGGASSISTSPPTPARNGRHNRWSRRFLGIRCPVISCGIAMRLWGVVPRQGPGDGRARSAHRATVPVAKSVRRAPHRLHSTRVLRPRDRVQRVFAASPSSISPITCARALTWCSAKTLRYHAPFSLRSSVPYSNFLKLVDSITGTNGGRREGLFPDRKGVSLQLESIPFREDSAQVRTGVSQARLPIKCGAGVHSAGLSVLRRSHE